MLSPRAKRAKHPDDREDNAKCPAFFAGFFFKEYTARSVVFFFKKG